MQRGPGAADLVPRTWSHRAISPDLSNRASLARHPELMDQPCSMADLRACLHDIAQVNRLTGAYRPTMQWLDGLYRVMPVQRRPLHIVDVGCGYGDFLRRIHLWAQDRQLPVTLTGIDLNPDTVQVARSVTIPGTATFLAGNVFDFDPPEGIDIVLSSLVMHHLETGEIVEMLRWMDAHARLGWFINDLHRQPLPYHAFRLFARMMPWHRFVQHDGPVSILRSFRRADWTAMLQSAAIPESSCVIRESRPARLCVSRVK